MQTVRLIPPWTAEPVELPVRAEAGRHVLRATVRRPADDAANIPPSALWRVSTDRPYDPAAFGVRGYPPDLVATFFRLSAEVANDRSNTPPLETIHPSEP